MATAFTLSHAYCRHVLETELLRAINEFEYALLFLIY